jgi:hypothetical protein
MTTDNRAFAPLYTQRIPGTTSVGECLPSTTVVAANASAVASTIFSGNTALNGQIAIRIANKTSVWVHVNFGVIGDGQVVRAATLNDFPVAPGSVEVMTVHPQVNAASVFADGAPAASTSVMFTRGDGV